MLSFLPIELIFAGRFNKKDDIASENCCNFIFIFYYLESDQKNKKINPEFKFSLY